MSIQPITTEFPTLNLPNLSVDQVAAIDTSGQSVLSPDTDAVSRRAIARDGGADVTVWRYPQDLGVDEQYPHYVMFYVNARSGTALADQRGRRDKDKNFMTADQSDQLRVDPENNTREGIAVGAAAGAAVGIRTVADIVKANSPLSSKLLLGGVGAILGGGVGAVVGGGYASMNKRPLIKIKDVIALHVNNPPATAYKAMWSEADMGGVWGIGGVVGDLTVKTALDEADIVARTFAGKLPKTVGGPNVKDAAEALTRKVSNPFKEQLFKSMGMRTFAFDYTFLPKNPQEARNVLNILRTFKRYMHPTIDTGKLFLVYPAEFNIVYYYRDKENPYVNKLSSCVLTDMNVRFGDGKDFTTFVGGFPSLVEIRLQFLELEMLTSERVDNDVTLTGTNYGF